MSPRCWPAYRGWLTPSGVLLRHRTIFFSSGNATSPACSSLAAALELPPSVPGSVVVAFGSVGVVVVGAGVVGAGVVGGVVEGVVAGAAPPDPAAFPPDFGGIGAIRAFRSPAILPVIPRARSSA